MLVLCWFTLWTSSRFLSSLHPFDFVRNLFIKVVDQPSDSSTNNNREDLKNSVIISRNAPADAGICCVQYRVVESDIITVNTTATTFTLYNITTREERENAFISVRCMDQIGTMGPEVMYRLDIGMLMFLITWFESVSLFQKLKLLLFVILNMLVIVVTCLCMKLDSIYRW